MRTTAFGIGARRLSPGHRAGPRRRRGSVLLAALVTAALLVATSGITNGVLGALAVDPATEAVDRMGPFEYVVNAVIGRSLNVPGKD